MDKENNKMPSVEELTERLKELCGESRIELHSTGLGDVHAIRIPEEGESMSWQCRSCMKWIQRKTPLLDGVFGMSVCDTCLEKAKKTGMLRVVLNPEAEVGVLTGAEDL